MRPAAPGLAHRVLRRGARCVLPEGVRCVLREGVRCMVLVAGLALAAAGQAQDAALPDDAEIDTMPAAAAAHVPPATAAAANTSPVAAAAASAPPAALLAQYEQALQAQARGPAPEPLRAALAALEAHCTPPVAASAAAAAAPATDGHCETRRRWRLQMMLGLGAHEAGAPDTARRHLHAALELARAGNDVWRQAFSESEFALLSQALQDAEGAQQHLARAQRLAAGLSDARLSTRLLLAEASLAGSAGQGLRARQLLERALAAARQGQSPRLLALAWRQQAEQDLRGGQAKQALAAATQGLAAADAAQDTRLARPLRAQRLLALTALGQHAQARQEFEALLAELAAEGTIGAQITLMRSYSDALAQVGRLQAALELVHRERTLSQQRMAAEREAALAALRTRYDREAQQRNILQLERDNALKSAELANQGLTQRLWAVGGGVLALALGLLLLLLARMRSTHRQLERRRARLRVQSERDALTGLANRRHFQAVLQAEQRAVDFRGALLMIDIDHFKRINDEHGHGAGDAVLVEVAQRVAAAAGPQDTVARWGGEEFLIFAPGLDRAQADALAQRLLQAVAGTAVALPGGVSLRVTTSIGHAVFPLPPHGVALVPEQAVNLVDMALYTAKSQGRNRAVGIVQAEAADAEGLRGLEGDFDRAWQEGRVRLRIDAGPPP